SPAKADWIERLAAGDYISAPLAEAALSATATRLTGLASAVPDADKASHVVLCASEGDCVALVPLGSPGIAIRQRKTWDTTQRLFDVQLDGFELENSLVLARGAAAQAMCQ